MGFRKRLQQAVAWVQSIEEEIARTKVLVEDNKFHVEAASAMRVNDERQEVVMIELSSKDALGLSPEPQQEVVAATQERCSSSRSVKGFLELW